MRHARFSVSTLLLTLLLGLGISLQLQIERDRRRVQREIEDLLSVTPPHQPPPAGSAPDVSNSPGGIVHEPPSMSTPTCTSTTASAGSCPRGSTSNRAARPSPRTCCTASPDRTARTSSAPSTFRNSSRARPRPAGAGTTRRPTRSTRSRGGRSTREPDRGHRTRRRGRHAGDSFAPREGDSHCDLVATPKVVHVGALQIGGFSNFRAMQLLQHSLKLPAHTGDLHTWMRTKFITQGRR